MAQSIGTVLIDIKADTQQLIQGFNKAEQTVNSAVSTMKNSITALTTAYLAFEGVISASKIVDISAQIEKQKAILKTLEGNGDAAKKSFEWIKDFAKQTPFELQQVTDAFIKAKSYGIDPTSGTLKTLGDTASAMGKDINQAIEALADAMVGENERLKEFGIKAAVVGNKISYSWTDSSGQTKKTVVENNKEIIKSTIEAIFNSKYQGAMKDQMNTWYGMVSNMKDNYTNFIDAVMTESGAFDGLKNIVKEIGDIGSSLNNLSPEQIVNATNAIKNMGMTIAGSYVSIKALQGAYSIYNEIEIARTKALDLETQSLKAKELAELATMKTANSYNLITKEANFQTQAQINNTKLLQAELLKQSVSLEKNIAKQTAMNTSLSLSSVGFRASAMGANLLKTAFSTIPFMVIATGISAIATSLLQASDSSEILEKTLKSTGEELGKLTANQLNYRKSLIETAIQDQKDIVRWQQMKAGIVGFKSELEIKKEKSILDEEKQKLSELEGSYKTLTDVLSNYNEQTNNKKKKEPEPIVRDDSAIIKLMGSDYQKLTLEIEENSKKLKDSGATQAEIDRYKADSIKDFNEKQSKSNEKANNEQKKLDDEAKKRAEDISKAYLDIAQIGMTEYDKSLVSITEKTKEWIKAGVSEADALKAQSTLIDELNAKTLAEQSQTDLSYYEKRLQLQVDSYDKELELQGISYAGKVLDIEASTKSIAEKDKLIAKENELYNATVQSLTYKDNLEFQNTMSSFYDDMLDSQLALNNAVYDFGSGFDGVSSKIGNVSKSIAAMSSLELTNKKEASKLDKKYIEQFNKYAGDVDKTNELALQYSKDKAIIDEQNIQAQIAGYANIAGAMSGMFEEGSREAASFQLLEGSLALASGIRAILTQGSGDPYTAFARMAAMAATVSSMLGNIGIAFGMNKTTTSSDSFSSTTANDGSGSVLGDSKKASESITNALETLKDFAQPQYETLLSMNNYLETIASSIGGVASLLVQNSSFALGTGYEGYTTAYKNNIGTNNTVGALLGGAGTLATAGAMGGFGAIGGLSVLGPAGLAVMAADKLLLGGALTNVVGGMVNTVLGGLFGKTSVTQSLKDSGIYFADTLLTSAIDQFDGEAYQTIATTKTKKSWFGKSSSTSISSYFEDLDSETERQFSLVLDNLYNTVLVAGTALDSAESTTANSLANFVVSLGKISLKDKTGTEIQELLTNAFGEIGDNIAKTAFPLLSSFQQVGEGMFETLTRVATGMEEAEYYIGRLGNSFADITYTAIQNTQGDVGFEALRQSIDAFDEATYGANNNLVKMIDSLDSTAQELYTVYTTLDELRDKLIFLGQSSQGISSSMIYGAGSVSDLQSGFTSYFENFLSESEQLDYKTQQLSSSFASLGLSMPNTNLAFKELLSSLDLTSASGQELYGRLITLSDSFAEISDSKVSLLTDQLDSTNTSISSLESISSDLESIITSLRSSVDTSSSTSLDKFARSMTTSLLLAQSGDYTALASSVKDTISYSSALNNSDYFTSARDMQYAQSVAANQFESMNLNLDTELSVLQKIADNTQNMINALSNLTTAVTALQESSSATASNTAVSRYVS